MLKKKDIFNFLNTGVDVFSSGTTGSRKKVFRSPKNIRNCVKTALKEQNITLNSSILTVTKLNHAGGLLAQTLPALFIGANVDIYPSFRPHSFFEEFKKHTHTFLPPRYIRVLMKSREFKDYDFQKKRILTGSEPVPWDIVESLLTQNAVVQVNWGMSEIGPIVIHSTFYSKKEIQKLKRKTPKNMTVLGHKICTDYKIKNEELFVKGVQCVHKGWFGTKDLVQLVENTLFYKGRKGVCN